MFSDAIEYEARLEERDRGTLIYEHITLKRLREIAASRSIRFEDVILGEDSERSELACYLRISEASTPVETFLLMSLPAELRNNVYEHALGYSEHSLVLPRMPALLSVSKQVRKEAGKIFFSFNMIALPIACGRYCPDFQNGKRYYQSITAPKPTVEWVGTIDRNLLSQGRSITICHHLFPVRLTDESDLFEVDIKDDSEKYELRHLGSVRTNNLVPTYHRCNELRQMRPSERAKRTGPARVARPGQERSKVEDLETALFYI